MIYKRFLSPILLGMLCSVSIGSFSPVIAVNKFTNKEHITARKEAIAHEHVFGKKMDYTAVGVAFLLVLGFSYKLVKSYFRNKQRDEKETLSNELLTNRLRILERKFEKTKEPKLFGKSWFKSLAKSIFTSFVSSSLAGIGLKAFDRFYKRYHCFGSLQEFLATRFEKFKSIDELLYNAQSYDRHALKSEQLSQSVKDRFVTSLRNTVSVVEHIVAFMEYKIDSYDFVSLAEEDLLLPSHLFDCLYSYCDNIEAVLEGATSEADELLEKTIFELTAQFKDDVLRFVEGFKGLEARVAWLH